MRELEANPQLLWCCFLGTVLFLCILPCNIIAQTVLDEDFESYSVGSINGQNGWTVSSGSCSITSDSNQVNTGTKAARFLATNQTMVINKSSYSGSEAGIGGVLYVDLWVKINYVADKDFAINGYDLYGGSEKRAFVFEFDAPSDNRGDFRIYNGSVKTYVGQYNPGEWARISAQVDYERSIYSVIFNGSDMVTVNFREDYTPTASGARPSNKKEYHQLRINLGYDSASGSVDAAIDDIYVGAGSIPDVQFPTVEVNYMIAVEQPEVGCITLDPDFDEYPENCEVTAKLILPEGYQNLGWTGDLNGTELEKIFTITRNMIVGATVAVDSNNPPAQYNITINQPDFGSILLNPEGGTYYKYTSVTAIVEVPVGYLFNGWTGDLSGTAREQKIVILQDMTIGASVVEDTMPAVVYTVSNEDDLRNICYGANLKPGDIVEVLDGSYNAGEITIETSGTSNQPIIIRAKNIDGAILYGDTYFDLRRAAFIQIEGFDIRSSIYTVIKLQACNHIRITRNIFHLTETEGESGKWILIGGIWNDASQTSHHNRIDHNIFKDKHQLGNFITIDGQLEPYNQMSQYDRIDHNYFHNIGPRAVNEMEAIRVGVSTLSMSSAFCTIEYNLFEECNGDPEIISLKSCDNVIRHNTFQRSEGTLCLRHGNRNEASGNYFFGDGLSGTGGIRVYGNDHKIFNNYFEGLTGTKWDAPITLTNGDYDGENSGGLSDHWRVKRAIICHNTLVNNDYNIEIGFTNNGNYTKTVKDVVFAGNLVVGKRNQLINIITEPDNLRWENNIMYSDSTAVLGVTARVDEIADINPLLLRNNHLWRLDSDSPAIDAAGDGYSFVNFDIDGQTRDELKDIGADEFSSTPVLCYPLNIDDVGPFAQETVASTHTENIIVRKLHLVRNYPNPFNLSTTITFIIGNSGDVNLAIFNLRGQKISELVNQQMSTGRYLIRWKAGDQPSGVYWLRLESSDGISTIPISLIK